uniref:S-acyltransferase n=1 Tax=Tetradesmus obliquus TaxID=3088 RepID=A0A383V6X1_TETOB|eukprot:jgi/Sobl393_1/6840/SZX60479.1
MDHHCPFINNCVGRGNLRPFLLFLLWTILAAAYVLAMCSALVWREWDVVRESAIIHSTLNQGSFGAPINGSSSSGGSSIAGSLTSPDLAAGVLISPAAHSTAALTSSSSSSVHMATAGQHAADAAGWSSARFVASGGMLLLLLQLAPGWLLATYYLAAACAALLLAVSALLVSQLNYLGSGVTYIQHLKRAAGSAAAAPGADSCTEHRQQANGNGSPCNGLQQVSAEQTDAGSAAAAGPVEFGARKPPHVQQVLQRQYGKWQVLWGRLQDVLGVDGSSGFAFSTALLVPQWQPTASAGVSTAVKKWS